jgi:LuxR family transcriptional regulator, maltose regulon positive regulatory protein
LTLMKLWGVWFLGMVCYHRNELECAEKHFSQIYDNRYVAQVSPYRDAIAGLAIIHQIKGETSAAWQKVESISQFDLEQRGSEDIRTRSLRARLRLLQGDLESARNWVDTFADPPPDMALMWLEEPQVTRARILLASSTDADLRLARQILEVLDEITGRTHNTRYRIEILALRALALEAQGETSAAESILKQAVDLARPDRFIRIFVDLGKPMQEMLRQLTRQGQSVDTIHHILSAFPAEYSPPEDNDNLPDNAKPARQQSPGNSMLAEPLTPRELEVLNLLRGPASIKEIALQLHISYATAKRHTINIYGKLGVNQRWNAVARAEELHIL